MGPAFSLHSYENIFKDFKRITEGSARRRLKMGSIGAGEMAQWLKALTVLPEDLGSMTRIHMVSHNCL